MGFWDRMKEIVEKGLETSKEVLAKAADKAKELGEKGVLKFEIMQLESQAHKKLALLGTKVFEFISKQKVETITAETEGIKELLAEIADIEVKIDAKEEAFKKL